MEQQIRIKVAQIFRRNQLQIKQQLLQSLQLISEEINLSLTSIRQSARQLYNAISLQTVKQHYSAFIGIQISSVNVQGMIDTYQDVLIMYCKTEDQSKVKNMIQRQISFSQAKLQSLAGKQQKEVHELDQSALKMLEQELKNIDTAPCLYRLCSTFSKLKGQDIASQLDTNLEVQIKQSLFKMISLIDRDLSQFQNVYSYSLAEEQFNELCKIFKNQYQNLKVRLQSDSFSAEEIHNMKELYLQITATLKEKINQVKMKELNHLNQIKQLNGHNHSCSNH